MSPTSMTTDYWFGVWLHWLHLHFPKAKYVLGGYHPTTQPPNVNLCWIQTEVTFLTSNHAMGFWLINRFFGHTPSARKHWGWSLAPGPHDDTEKKCLKGCKKTFNNDQKSPKIQSIPSVFQPSMFRGFVKPWGCKTADNISYTLGKLTWNLKLTLFRFHGVMLIFQGLPSGKSW